VASVIAVTTRPAAGGGHSRPTVVSCQARDVLEALQRLEADASVRLMRTPGALRPGVVVFVNSADARLEGGLGQALHDGDVVRALIPVTDT
jgi:hypothetical protein